MRDAQHTIRKGLEPALVVVLAGICAALHVGKLPPALPALQQALGVTLVQAGFLLSLVQMAGMLLGIAVGLAADGFGARRSMASGLLLLALASALGGTARDVPLLMLLRAAEGLGFLLVVLPAPGLVRRLVAPQRMSLMLGAWGTFMPAGTATALLLGPLCISAWGWQAWWWALAGVSLLMAVWLVRAVPETGRRAPPEASGPAPPLGESPAALGAGSRTAARARLGRVVPAGQPAAAAPADVADTWRTRLRLTLASRGPWLVAWSFALYSSQWLAVIGFLPVIYTQAGVSDAATGVLTALAAAVNIIGNVASGRLLHGGARAGQLLTIGFIAMALAALAAFAGGPGVGLPPSLRYLAVLVFSMAGGMIPATLFSLAVRVAPSESTLASTVGWMQQWSALGQFCGPPLVAWVASRSGDWQWTWVVTGAFSLLGLALVRQLRAFDR